MTPRVPCGDNEVGEMAKRSGRKQDNSGGIRQASDPSHHMMLCALATKSVTCSVSPEFIRSVKYVPQLLLYKFYYLYCFTIARAGVG